MAMSASMRYGVLYRDLGSGLFSAFDVFCGGIRYCCTAGLVPVIDMQSHDSLYSGKAGINSWEFFFEQPCGISVNDISGADRVDFDPARSGIAFPDWTLLNPAADVREWRRLVRTYMRIKHANLRMYANARLDAVLSRGRVLGVLARGTDYTSCRPRRHFVQPPVARIIGDSKRIMANNGFDAVYLVTEDKHVRSSFIDAFGDDMLITSRQPPIDYTPGRLLHENSSVYHNVTVGTAYCKAIYDLSRCHGLLSGVTNGAVAAKLLSAGYEYEQYYALGRY